MVRGCENTLGHLNKFKAFLIWPKVGRSQRVPHHLGAAKILGEIVDIVMVLKVVTVS